LKPIDPVERLFNQCLSIKSHFSVKVIHLPQISLISADFICDYLRDLRET